MKKSLTPKTIFLPLLMLLLCFQSMAQSLSTDDIKSQLVKEWERAKEYTVKYLNTMPKDKYSFKAVDSIRSFAQQMLHLANANLFLMTNATGIPPLSWMSNNIEERPGAQTSDSVMYYVTSSYDYCINAVKNTDLNKWGEKVKLFGMEMTRFALMIKTFEHQTHHRGQTTIYIRLLGIRPPQEQLF
jgi:uncharacterized damage-inducible protein DinB